jgi:SAM-dependent methyltransferase
LIAEFAKRWIGAVIDWRRVVALRYLPRYLSEWLAFRRQAGTWSVRVADSYPCLADRLPSTPFDPHYFYQGNWLARCLAEAQPSLHVDVGSSVLTLGVLSAHVPTLFVDYRPLEVRQRGLQCIAGDITRLPFADRAVASLSSLHVIEHIGLGRYGDPLDAGGARRAAEELQRIVGEGGRLYLSTPIGRERVCFNAHRVFAPATIQSMFPQLELVRFCFVADDGTLVDDASPSQVPPLEYGCGFFEFRRAR